MVPAMVTARIAQVIHLIGTSHHQQAVTQKSGSLGFNESSKIYLSELLSLKLTQTREAKVLLKMMQSRYHNWK